MSNCFVKKDWAIRASTPNPTKVKTQVYREHAHGFRNRDRLLLLHSTMLSGVISLAGGCMMKSSFSLCGEDAAEAEVLV